MSYKSLKALLAKDHARLRVETDPATIRALRIRMGHVIADIAKGGAL